MRLPDLKLVLTGTPFGYKRDDGVFVIPIGCLKTENVVVEQNEMIDKLDVTVSDLQVLKPAPVFLSASYQYGAVAGVYTLSIAADDLTLKISVTDLFDNTATCCYN